MLTPTMRQAWLPCARALPRSTLGAAAVLAAAPTLIVLTRGGSSFEGALVMAALVCGAAGAFIVDDPAEETLAASPTSLAARRALRGSVLALGIGLLAVLLVTVPASAGHTGVTTDGLARRAAELAATAGLAAAVAGAIRRQSPGGAAHGGAVGGLLAVLALSALAHRFHSLPALVDSPHHLRWWAVAAVAWVATAWTCRDPAR